MGVEHRGKTGPEVFDGGITCKWVRSGGLDV